jgi:iron(III) transport system ATP-binding protein
MMPLLQVKNISKRYSGQTIDAVHRLSLDVFPGELLAIVGASGSGKTTLLKMIAALEEADDGSVWLHGQPLPLPSQQLIPGHPKIKMVFQDNKLFPNIRIYDNIQYTLRAYPFAYQQERIAQVLELCRLTHLQQKYPRELSGGEQQRATLARALADEPELLLLDEPFSHLDLPLKRQIKKEVEDILQASGITAILVTHDIADALSMADRIALMKMGSLVQIDAPYKIYEQPATPYVAQFFGEVNMLEWRVLQAYIPKSISIPADLSAQVCLRAEHIAIATTDAFHCKGRVTSIEYMGAYSLIEAWISENLSLIFRTSAHQVKKGDWLPLLINMQKLYFFETKAGELKL